MILVGVYPGAKRNLVGLSQLDDGRRSARRCETYASIPPRAVAEAWPGAAPSTFRQEVPWWGRVYRSEETKCKIPPKSKSSTEHMNSGSKLENLKAGMRSSII